MKKLVVTCICTAVFSIAQASTPLDPEAPAVLSGPIPIELLEIQFNQCIRQHSELGNNLVGSYCQCISKAYYQNLPYMGFVRFSNSLITRKNDAIEYQQRVSSNCFTEIARGVGPR